MDKTEFTAVDETSQSAGGGRVQTCLEHQREAGAASSICGPGAREKMENAITHV